MINSHYDNRFQHGRHDRFRGNGPRREPEGPGDRTDIRGQQSQGPQDRGRDQGHRRWDGANRIEAAAASSVGAMSGAAHSVHGGIMRNPHHAEPGDLKAIARSQMEAGGLATDFSKEALQQLDAIKGAAQPEDGSIRDLRSLLWSSIDNDDSKDLDQIEWAERQPNGDVKVLVAIADVDALVPKDSPIDKHATFNTTSVYTGPEIFPLLPEKLSTDLTSLNPDVDRLALVVEMTVGQDGEIKSSYVYRAQVHNHCKMAYDSVSAWLNGKGPEPAAMSAVPGIAEQVRLQDEVAARLKAIRHDNGALDLQSLETRAVIKDGQVTDVKLTDKNRARDLIEDFMVAANGVTARFLEAKGYPTLRRVVKTPQKWDKIVTLAGSLGTRLPNQPDAPALEKFLVDQRKSDPVHFPDLSSQVVRLLGRGEYVVHEPGKEPPGHFCLAVKDYGHFTAENRRDPDLIQGRIAKDAIAGKPCRYSVAELEELAQQCTDREAAAAKVERQVEKSSWAALLQDRIGESFQGVVSAAGEHGTFVRILEPPVEGRIQNGNNLKQGASVTVTLQSVNIERGFIDFSR